MVALQLSNFEFELLKSYNQQVRNDPKIEFQKRVEILHQINAVHQNAAAARGFLPPSARVRKTWAVPMPD